MTIFSGSLIAIIMIIIYPHTFVLFYIKALPWFHSFILRWFKPFCRNDLRPKIYCHVKITKICDRGNEKMSKIIVIKIFMAVPKSHGLTF